MSIQRLVLRGSMQDQLLASLQGDNCLIYLMVNLPYQCNYRCLKCCNLKSGSRHDPRLLRARTDMDVMRRVLSAAKGQGIAVAVFAGEGEPLLDPAFGGLVESAVTAGLIPYVFTNGSLLDSDAIAFLANHRASLIIGLDSMQDARYRRLTGDRGDLKKVLASIAECRKRYSCLVEIQGNTRVVSLAINMVVNSLNVDEVARVREFCGDDIAFVCNQPTCVGLAEKNWSLLHKDEPATSKVDSVLKAMSAQQVPLGTTADGQWCAYMRNGVSISPEGQVLTCAYCLDTAGAYRPLRLDNLAAANADVMASVNAFYRRHGHSRCMLRHPKYKEFLAFLEEGGTGEHSEHEASGVEKG